MKNYTINTAAAWVATLSTWQDGDVFRETNTDTVTVSIGNHLGYLKTAVDGKPDLTSNNTWVGNQEFDGDVTCGGDFTAGTVDCSGVSCSGAVSFSGTADAGVERRILMGSDAAATIIAGYDQIRIPILTANRVYTLSESAPVPRTGAKLEIIRNANSDAFTLTVHRAGGTTIGIFPASAANHMTVTWSGSKWLVDTVSAGITTFANTD